MGRSGRQRWALLKDAKHSGQEAALGLFCVQLSDREAVALEGERPGWLEMRQTAQQDLLAGGVTR